jgi:hypothetical protein
MRSTWLGLAIGFGLLASCGSDEQPRTDRGQIEATVTSYFDAAAAGDGDEACRWLTAGAQRDIANRAGTESCEKGIAQVGDALPPEARHAMHEARPADVTIRGRTAQVTVALEGVDPVFLEKGAGGWRITVLRVDQVSRFNAEGNCITSGMQEFDGADRFWRREGRGDFKDLVVATCRQAAAKGLLDDAAAIERIARRVMRRMARRGQIPDPR